MAELREVFEVTTNQIEPDLDAWKEQSQRQRHSARSRKLRAMAVAAAVAVGAALFAARVLDRGSNSPAPASVVPSTHEVALTIVELDGSIRSSVAELPGDVAMPALSPDGTRVAFTLTRQQDGMDGLGSQIAISDLSGAGEQRVTNGTRQSDEWPRWSPDGTRLLFYRILSYRSQGTNGRGYIRLMVMDADGSDARVIRGTRSPDGQPAAWSPDGSQILYTSVAGGRHHLESIPVAGGRSRRFGLSHRGESEGSWSPDGRSIAFVRQVNVTVEGPASLTPQLMKEIWLMNADGTDKRPLATLPGANAEAPVWSPDGTMVAFIGSIFGIGGAESDSDAVYVVDVATGEINQVLQGVAVGVGHDSLATWLPEGDALLVMSHTT